MAGSRRGREGGIAINRPMKVKRVHMLVRVRKSRNRQDERERDRDRDKRERE